MENEGSEAKVERFSLLKVYNIIGEKAVSVNTKARLGTRRCLFIVLGPSLLIYHNELDCPRQAAFT